MGIQYQNMKKWDVKEVDYIDTQMQAQDTLLPQFEQKITSDFGSSEIASKRISTDMTQQVR